MKTRKRTTQKSVLVFMFPLCVQLGWGFICISIDIRICKCMFMCLGFFSLGENFFPKYLVPLVCFPQKFAALTDAILYTQNDYL